MQRSVFLRCVVRWVVFLFVVASSSAALAVSAATDPPGDGAPVDVSVVFYLIDVVRLDAADQSAEVDFLVVLNWHDPRLVQEQEGRRALSPSAIWTPQFVPLQGRRFLSIVWEAASVDGAGQVRLSRRYAGPLSIPLQLQDFPFDHHDVRLSFVSAGGTGDVVQVALDEQGSGQAPSLTAPDWIVGPGHLHLDPYRIASLDVSRPGFSYTLPVQRRKGFYIWAVISPLMAIIAMSWAVFWLNPVYVGQKLSIATTSILTLIAYRFALGTQLPRLSYLTRMDYFILGATILIFVAFLKVIVEAGLVHAKRDATAIRIDEVCRWAFPMALIGLMAGSFWV